MYQIYKHKNDIAASLKNFGNRCAALFQKKKKDAEEVAQETEKDAKECVEEDVENVANALEKTKLDVEKSANENGIYSDSKSSLKTYWRLSYL